MQQQQYEYEQAKESLERYNQLLIIASMLNCGIDKQTMAILVSLCENGINPNGIIRLMKEINREKAADKMK